MTATEVPTTATARVIASLPWVALEPIDREDPRVFIGPAARDRAFAAITTGDDDAAKGEFIVRVCNAHPALVAAIADFLTVWDSWAADASSVNPLDAIGDSDIDALRAALAAARPSTPDA